MPAEHLNTQVEQMHYGINKELVHDFVKLPGFKRLDHITSLGALALPGREAAYSSFRGFTGTRATHTLNVLHVAAPIMVECELSRQERDALTFAVLSHDIATPAGGDAVKEGRPELDEETHWRDGLGEDGISLLTKFGVDEDKVGSTILNSGLLGEILDIADRIAYVTADTRAFIGDDSLRGFVGIERDIKHDERGVYFRDVHRLHSFLHRRALNHRQLYSHPENRARYAMMRDLVDPMYATDGSRPLSPALLRRMTDDQLYEKIVDFHNLPFGSPQEFLGWLLNVAPEFAVVTDETKKYRPLIDTGLSIHHGVFIGHERQRTFQPGTEYRVAEGRSVNTFKNAKPRWAFEIEELAQPDPHDIRSFTYFSSRQALGALTY